MKTLRLIIICLTVLLVAWMKYVVPVLDHAADREMQWELFMRGIHARPSLQLPAPEVRKL